MARKNSNWHESDFENFFIGNPILHGKPLLIINRQKALHRVVDIVALDEDGRILIIEVKNETSTRTVIGQALEYLSLYDGITLDDLGEEYRDNCGRSLQKDFEAKFQRTLSLISTDRRVVLVAPSFDPHSSICVQFLCKQWPGSKITFELIQAEQTPSGFTLTKYVCPPLQSPGKLEGQFAMTIGGRMVYVLKGGNPAILWTLGKRRKGDALYVPTGKAVTARCLRFSRRLLVPMESAPPEADLKPMNTTWTHPAKPNDFVKLLGHLDNVIWKKNKDDCVLMARFRNGQFRYFQVKSKSQFLADWRPAKADLPDWFDIVTASRQKNEQRQKPKGIPRPVKVRD